ncbi:hypothetical protein ESCO_005160 [Escovopsis weberi]|uniref:Uncharacterized protein n=1 Tax=Escovopsis weberi TaxID=150374 RepID=A0A0M8MXZ7_ESCWE|nr:hypothetical protein ESCO_005160 [Escovopsis weberi]
MKKATIKRRKRVIPAFENEEDESVEVVEMATADRFPERGTVNADGSVNLGLRRNAEHPMTIEPEPVVRASRNASPLPAASDLAAYHQPTGTLRRMHSSRFDENRLAPMASIAAPVTEERKSSLSPASFMTLNRKRSFSMTEVSAGVPDGPADNSKRVSSIKAILNPSNGSDDVPVPTTIGEEKEEYALPPILRAPNGGDPVPQATSYLPLSLSPPPPPPPVPDASAEAERAKAERRTLLRLEAERMRELLAAKERELMELGE